MLTLPNILTMLRVIFIPVIGLVYYSGHQYAHQIAAIVFGLTAATDALDGYLARKWNQTSKFGAFLDPVADKLAVAVCLVILLQNEPTILMALCVAIIIGREITISALREWMAELGERATVKVSIVGKLKTIAQMAAIGFMMWEAPTWGLPVYQFGQLALYIAAALTLWSMISYLKAAWPVIRS